MKFTPSSAGSTGTCTTGKGKDSYTAVITAWISFALLHFHSWHNHFLREGNPL